MKKNGFTLIELLAVIAILAVILLIAVPMVLNTISTSRDNSLKASAAMLWTAAENCVAMNTINTTNCAIPTVNATAAFAGFRSTGLTGMAGGTDSGEVLASNWRTLGSTNFSGKYLITFGANNTTVTSVQVSHDAAAAGAISGRRCTITSKTGTCTMAG